MSRKFSNLEKSERKLMEEELEGKSSALGLDSWEAVSNVEGLNKMKDQVGICFDCKYLNYCKTEFEKVHAICTNFEFRLSGHNRITVCNCHTPRHVLSLTEMYSMAYLIDPAEPKVKGFISKDKELLGKPKNKK